MKIYADKISSSTRHARLSRELTLGDEIISKEGYILAVRTLTHNSVYNSIELVSGRMSKICKGDVVAGVLGYRNALKGYSGIVPDSLKPGDIIQVLNMGGVLGQCTSDNPELGKPIDAEVLGAVLHFPSFMERIGRPASIHGGKIEPKEVLKTTPPLIIVTGTCMSAGKTRVACELIKHLTEAGKKVGAGKLSGVSLMRDTLEMQDFGASSIYDFTDVGIVSTKPDSVLPAAKGIVSALAAENPDCIVLEFGDGIMGEYGVMTLLLDKELMSNVSAHVLAANDPVGAWGALNFLQGKCPPIDIISGPATDNEVGRRFVREKLNLQAANALRNPEDLAKAVMTKVFGG